MLADYLAKGLHAQGINQAELARRAGLTRAYVGRLLAGSQGAPTAAVLEQLSGALALSSGDRLRLFVAAGLVPPEVGTLLLTHPGIGRFLAAVAVLPRQRQDAVEELLDAVIRLGIG